MTDGLSETVRHGLSVKYFASGVMFGIGAMIAIQPSVSTPLERYGIAVFAVLLGVIGWFYVRAEESEHRTEAITDETEGTA